MIDDEKYSEILENGLILDHYFLLCNLSKGIKPIENKRIRGFINLLTKKGYIQDDAVTEKGLIFVNNCSFSEPVKKVSELVIDYATWVTELHKKCQDKLVELTGKKQYVGKIESKSYSFLPNVTDLAGAISKVISIYKTKDYERIEKTILRYIESCYRERTWFPILQYYIIKNNMSKLITDMENIDEELNVEYKSKQRLL